MLVSGSRTWQPQLLRAGQGVADDRLDLGHPVVSAAQVTGAAARIGAGGVAGGGRRLAFDLGMVVMAAARPERGQVPGLGRLREPIGEVLEMAGCVVSAGLFVQRGGDR